MRNSFFCRRIFIFLLATTSLLHHDVRFVWEKRSAHEDISTRSHRENKEYRVKARSISKYDASRIAMRAALRSFTKPFVDGFNERGK